MSLDNSRIPKLSDSSRKFISTKPRKSLNDLFVGNNEWARNKNEKKISGGMLGKKKQKTSEETAAMLEVEIR